ncbi:hypothetical protein [Paenibacillus pseudetheri]|uniref:Major tropism determinant N-terminal domain-containing protein n=1 Tax=Paenibacillus pseudetheri TaxID=2897682 RepID=A0ABN8F7L5_9BACL|nr:hypothetical protein [Paenibacillus pseudetheri]CAH1054023.1 hypothetical protein PAECIP111894_00168 [Paenibacillus pseudetheri]
MANKIQLMRGTKAQLTAKGGLSLAEPGYCTDTKDLYIGNTSGGDSLFLAAANIPYNAYRQAIINGNFDVWQRGYVFVNPASMSYIADRFFAAFSIFGGGSLPSITHSRQIASPGDIPGAFWHYRLNTNGAGSGFGVSAFYGLFQRIESGAKYLCGSGKKFTVSFFARSSIPGKRLGVGAQVSYGTGGTPTAVEDLAGKVVTLNTAWTKYEVPIEASTLVGKIFGTNNDDYLQLSLYSMWGSTTGSINLGGATAETFRAAGNIDIAQIQINIGESALPFQPRFVSEELSLCQRYFEKSYDQHVDPGSSVGIPGHYQMYGSTAANTYGGRVLFSKPKRMPPTVIVYDMSGVAGKASAWNGGTLSSFVTAIDSINQTGFRVIPSLTAGYYESFGHYTADAEL